MSKRSAAEPLPEGAKRVAVDADQRDPSARDPRGLGDPSLRREAGAGKRLPKRKLALLLGYRGANYYGLQKQSKESDLPTIELALQEALNRAGAVHEGNQGDLSKIGWSRAARTDKRVSAARQVVSAKLEVENDDVPALLERLNGELPDDIKVFDAVRVIKGFNCKQSCDRRHYTYLLPTFLLAPDEAIDAAFDAVGYGHDRVADCRKRALAARAAGEHPTDWKLDDAAAAEVAQRLAPHRAAPTLLERLRGFLAAYVGTRKYHNFTNKLKPTDMAAQRFIVSFTADDPTYPSGDAATGAEWVKLDVVGQSFLMHMIRKMVAVAAEAASRESKAASKRAEEEATILFDLKRKASALEKDAKAAGATIPDLDAPPPKKAKPSAKKGKKSAAKDDAPEPEPEEEAPKSSKKAKTAPAKGKGPDMAAIDKMTADKLKKELKKLKLDTDGKKGELKDRLVKALGL